MGDVCGHYQCLLGEQTHPQLRSSCLEEETVCVSVCVLCVCFWIFRGQNFRKDLVICLFQSNMIYNEVFYKVSESYEITEKLRGKYCFLFIYLCTYFLMPCHPDTCTNFAFKSYVNHNVNYMYSFLSILPRIYSCGIFICPKCLWD